MLNCQTQGPSQEKLLASRNPGGQEFQGKPPPIISAMQDVAWKPWYMPFLPSVNTRLIEWKLNWGPADTNLINQVLWVLVAPEGGLRRARTVLSVFTPLAEIGLQVFLHSDYTHITYKFYSPGEYIFWNKATSIFGKIG